VPGTATQFAMGAGASAVQAERVAAGAHEAAAASAAIASAVESMRAELLDAVGQISSGGGPTQLGPAEGAFTASRQDWQQVGTVELTKPPPDDRKCSIGVTLGPSVTDPLRLVSAPDPPSVSIPPDHVQLLLRVPPAPHRATLPLTLGWGLGRPSCSTAAPTLCASICRTPPTFGGSGW
jgi:hypothetical protein